MKNLYFILFITSVLFVQDMQAQVPQGFNYQAVARDINDNIIKDDFVSIRFWLLEDSPSGTPVYRETHQAVYTGLNGVITLVVGQGNAGVGTFSSIDWGSKNYFLRVDLDANAGSNYTQMGTTQLLTVPYAMFAMKSGSGGSGGNDDWGTQTVQSNNTLIGDGTSGNPLRVDQDLVNTDNQTLNINGDQLSINGGNTISLPVDGDGDSNNEIQMLSINGNNLTISNGNTISIPTGGTDADADPLNEIQNLSNNTSGNDVTVEISRGGDNTTFSIEDDDSDPTGELQELSISGNMITLNKGGGTISVPTGGTDADADPMNEIQNLSNNTSGNDVTIEISRGGDNTTFSVEDDDSDSMNEIQDLALIGADTLTLSGSDSIIVLADNDPMNEIQNLGVALLGASDIVLDIDNGQGVQFSINDGDPNPTNELQNLSVALLGASDIVLDIDNGQGVQFSINDGDSNPTNEFQELDINTDPEGFSISITGNGAPVEFVEAPFHQNKNVIILDGGTQTINLGTASVGGGALSTNGPGGSQITYTGADNNGQGFVTIVSGGAARAGMQFNGAVAEVFGDVKNFRMDYPGRSGKEIWYASVEGPEAGAYERGTATLVNGEVFVPFTDHFQMVIVEKGMTVMLTPLSGESLGLAVIEKTSTGFRVKELHKGTGNYSFDWEVKGVRAGFENYKVIRDKSSSVPSNSSQ